MCALSIAAGFPAQAPSQTKETTTEDEPEKVEPRFIWGVLIQFAVSKLSSLAFEVFLKWAVPRLTGGTEGLSDYIVANLMRDSGARIVPRGAGALPVAQRPGNAPQVVVGNPTEPLRVDGDQANYQGVHVALMMSEDGGKRFVFRPVNEGFRTGERFKLRMVSTFGGELTLDNVNPRGETKQIYPPGADQVVTLLPGKETLVPLAPDQFFEFTGATGHEQLIIHLVDTRAVGDRASANKVYRQDTKFGSNFLQEVSPNTFPVVRQAVDLVHAAR